MFWSIQDLMSVELLRTSWTQRKQKAANNIFKIDDPPNFQIQVANAQLQKRLATATLKFVDLTLGITNSLSIPS